MTRDRQTVRYRCFDCSHEFTAGPGPVRGGAPHVLPGTGHPAVTDGACPSCGGLYVGRVQCNPGADERGPAGADHGGEPAGRAPGTSGR